MTRRFAAVLSVAVFLLLEPLAFGQGARGFQATAVKQSPFRKSVEQISVAQLKDYLSFVAADEMEGRSTPSRGLDTTARFIATMLGRWNVKPAGDDGAYFQRIVLKREKLAPEGAALSLGTQKFAPGKDFFASPVAGDISGGLVYGGDGWYIKAKNIDAYEGLDPKGKIVVVASSGGLPRGISYNEMSSLGTRGEDWIDPVAYAQKKGAVAVVLLTPLLQQANPEALDALAEPGRGRLPVAGKARAAGAVAARGVREPAAGPGDLRPGKGRREHHPAGLARRRAEGVRAVRRQAARAVRSRRSPSACPRRTSSPSWRAATPS